MHLIYFVVTLIYFIIWNDIDSYRDYIFIFILHRMIHIIHSFFICFYAPGLSIYFSCLRLHLFVFYMYVTCCS